MTTVAHQGLYFREVRLPKILVEPKFLISVAKAKLLLLTTITGILKNQFGCLPEKHKFRYHHRYLEEVIIDLNKVLKPDLCVVDAIVVQEGVEGGRIRPIGVVILGRSPASVDSVMAQVMRFNPKEIRHLVLAEEQGLGSLNPAVVGESIGDVAVSFRKRVEPLAPLAVIRRYIPEDLTNMLAPFLERVF